MRKTFNILVGLVVMFLFVCPLIARDANRTPLNEPAVVAAVAPDFPAIARSAHASGEVVVEVTLSSDGKVETSKSLSGHPLLQKAAENAAKKWKFTLADDHTAKVRLTFSFGYVDDGKKSDPELLITFMPPYKVEVMINSARIPIIN